MSGNSRIPSSQPEAFLPLLFLSALLLGLGALFGEVFGESSPVRVGETAILGTPGNDPDPEKGYPVLLSKEAREEYLAVVSSRWLSYPRILYDEERTIWAEAGTEVEVIDASHRSFTGIRILDGVHAGRSGWVWKDAIRDTGH